MISAQCYHCEKDEADLFDKENGYNLVRCRICGLLFVSPRPDDATRSEAIRTGFHSGEKQLDVNARGDEVKRTQYHRVLQNLFTDHEITELRKTLDVGCGYGEFIAELKEFSPSAIQIAGFEPNEIKRNVALQNGHDVRPSMSHFGDTKFDLISLLNVFSHLSNPREDFRNYRKILQPNGLILIQTGDAAGLEPKAMPKPYFLPDHLSFASEIIIKNILEQEGFKVLKVYRYPAIHFTWWQLAKEIIKTLLPRKKSNLIALLNHRKYAHRDMYILARKWDTSPAP